MRISLFLLLLLTGCAQPAQTVEAVLNEYALAAANSSNLAEHLSGAALESAQQSADLVAELGLVGYGASSFSATKALDSNRYRSCLDVSGTSFRDVNGVELQLERIERQLVEVEFLDGKVSNLELLGEAC